MDLRAEYKDVFQEKHGVKLGFMSGFVKVDTTQHFSCHIRETYYAIVFSM
jgi:pyruvate/2-oxoglutarate dehydrogenase complex dihydrolipoamide acyltransferase (E2) component